MFTDHRKLWHTQVLGFSTGLCVTLTCSIK
jgi:hypothetical protein